MSTLVVLFLLTVLTGLLYLLLTKTSAGRRLLCCLGRLFGSAEEEEAKSILGATVRGDRQNKTCFESAFTDSSRASPSSGFGFDRRPCRDVTDTVSSSGSPGRLAYARLSEGGSSAGDTDRNGNARPPAMTAAVLITKPPPNMPIAGAPSNLPARQTPSVAENGWSTTAYVAAFTRNASNIEDSLRQTSDSHRRRLPQQGDLCVTNQSVASFGGRSSNDVIVGSDQSNGRSSGDVSAGGEQLGGRSSGDVTALSDRLGGHSSVDVTAGSDKPGGPSSCEGGTAGNDRLLQLPSPRLSAASSVGGDDDTPSVDGVSSDDAVSSETVPPTPGGSRDAYYAGGSATNGGELLRRAVSTDSVNSGSFDSYNKEAQHELGQLEIRLNYDRPTHMVEVRVSRLFDLRVPSAVLMEFWVVGFLLPHPKPLWRTQTLSARSNPIVFERDFQQCVTSKDVRRLALLLQLYGRTVGPQPDSNPAPFAAQHTPPPCTLIAQCRIRLKDFQIFNAPRTLWLSMLPAAEDVGGAANNTGEVVMSLSYSPTAERLTVIISQLNNLFNADRQRQPTQNMVRAYLVLGSRVSKKKTSKKSVSSEGKVEISEVMIFNLQQTKLPKVYLRLSIIDCTPSGRSVDDGIGESIGHVTIGSRRSGKELGHWQKTIQSPLSTVTMRHLIKPKQC